MSFDIKISFRISEQLKEKLATARIEDKYPSVNDYLRDIFNDYLTTGEYERMDIKRSDVDVDKINPACLPISNALYNKIEETREVVNRGRSEFLEMILTDFIKKRDKDNE